MTPGELVITLLGAGTVGTLITQITVGIGKRITGAAPRERAKNNTIEAQRTRAIEERDIADKAREEGIRAAEEDADKKISAARQERDDADVKRRKIEEYASSLRRQLLENGITPGEWPIDITANITK